MLPHRRRPLHLGRPEGRATDRNASGGPGLRAARRHLAERRAAGRLGRPATSLVALIALVATAVVAIDRAGSTGPAASPPPPRVGDAAPAYPLHSVPGYATYTGWRARTADGDGPIDFVAAIPIGTSSTPVYGDWDGDGAFQPGYFLNGSWVLFDRMVGTRTAWRTFPFGKAGDKAVVGDWNGDGRTDIGVVRNGTWFERDAASGGGASRSFTFGTTGDKPLVGDWDGDGIDTPGLRRSATIFERNANSVGSPSAQFAFGRSSDTAVVGDWDGDGVDTVGVARASTSSTPAAWYLTAGPGQGPVPVTQVTITGGAGGYPLPYPSPAGPAGAACPTILPGVNPTAQSLVQQPGHLGGAMPADSLRDALDDAEKTMLGVKYDASYAPRVNLRYLDIRSDAPNEEWAVRGAAMSTVSVAIGLATDGYDDARVGKSRDFALGYVDWLLRSSACQHRSISPGGWGHTWQSAMWAEYLGVSAWLLWDQLPAQTQAYVAHVVADEANWAASQGVPYWKDRNGNYLPGRQGNSAAEEAAWDAGHLGMASQMLAGHPNADQWNRVGVQLAVAAYSIRPDTVSNRSVNGIALGTRLGGFNAFDDGTVENHGGIQVDYITVAQYQWWTAIFAGLSGRSVPEAFLHNSRLGWLAISKLNFTVPPFNSPGGSVYRPDGTTYYPQVSDWGTKRYPQWLSYDSTADLVAADVDPRTNGNDQPTALTWMDRHTSQTRSLQQRHSDGHIYDPGEERYVRAEELNAQLIAMGWAARYAARHLPPAAVDRGYVPLP